MGAGTQRAALGDVFAGRMGCRAVGEGSRDMVIRADRGLKQPRARGEVTASTNILMKQAAADKCNSCSHDGVMRRRRRCLAATTGSRRAGGSPPA